MGTSHTTPVQIGERLLGKYVVERVLGAGGMGCVVAARHTELDELFAVKLMLPQALNNGEAVERFTREARAAAKLKNEHVAKVHDVGRLDSGMPYMVMEHLSGRDLAAVLKAHGPLPLAHVAGYVLQALEALEEAHGLGIVHRDIKPANLFVTQKPNGTACVKVLDFGVSKHTTPDGALDMTKTQAVLGSPFYMSPEQMMSTRTVDRRTDIWALGVTLYQLTTGRLPFRAEAITELVGRVLTEEPVPPSQVLATLPPAFDDLMRRCLAKKAEQRFQNAAELRAALAPFAAMTAPGAVPAYREAGPVQPSASGLSSSGDRSAPLAGSNPLGQSQPGAWGGASSPALASTGTQLHAQTTPLPGGAPLVPGPAPASATAPPTNGSLTGGGERAAALAISQGTVGEWSGGGSPASRRGGLKTLVLVAALGVVVVGGVGIWLATRPPAASAAASGTESALAASTGDRADGVVRTTATATPSLNAGEPEPAPTTGTSPDASASASASGTPAAPETEPSVGATATTTQAGGTRTVTPPPPGTKTGPAATASQKPPPSPPPPPTSTREGIL